MKKLAVNSLLLLVIFLSFSFIYFKSQALGSEDNYFNRHLRDDFAAIPWLRQALGLHFDGDGRADYLGKRYQKILLEVDVMDTLSAHLASLDLVAKKLQEVTQKPTTYLISDRRVVYDRALTRESIGKLVKRFRTHAPTRDTATLYLLYGSKMAEEPSSLGLTYQEYGIIIFVEALEEFTAKNPETLQNYEASTILHEFGHQLGLPHNNEPACLMNEHAEERRVVREKPEEVIIDFCEYEKNEIRNLTSLPLAITFRGTLSSSGESSEE